MTSEVMHNLDLTADVFNVITLNESAGGDGFASKLLLRFLVGDEIGDSELASTQLTAERVCVADVLHGTTEDSANRGSGRRGAIGGL